MNNKMKKILKLYALIISAIVISTSITACKKDNIEDSIEHNYRIKLEAESGIVVHIDGVEVHKFDVTLDQVVYKADRLSYMVTNLDQTKYYLLTLDTPPTLGEVVAVKFKSVGIEGVENKLYTMTVIKESSDKLWLWDSGTLIGFVVDFS